MSAASPLADDQEAVLALLSMAYPEIIAQIEILKSLAEEQDIEFSGPLTENELRNFERQNGCVLPVNYRCFLLLAGNFTIPPYTEKWFEPLPVVANVPPKEPTWLSRPFALTADWYKSGEYETDQADQGKESPYMQATYDAYDLLVDGCLLLHETGDSGYYLAITGPEPGVVWQRDANLYQDLSWHVSIERQDEFLSWITEMISEGFSQ